MASYTNPMLPLVPELVPAVADWILTLAATSPDPEGPGSGA
jgi:hypothetical protein